MYLRTLQTFDKFRLDANLNFNIYLNVRLKPYSVFSIKSFSVLNYSECSKQNSFKLSADGEK